MPATSTREAPGGDCRRLSRVCRARAADPARGDPSFRWGASRTSEPGRRSRDAGRDAARRGRRPARGGTDRAAHRPSRRAAPTSRSRRARHPEYAPGRQVHQPDQSQPARTPRLHLRRLEPLRRPQELRPLRGLGGRHDVRDRAAAREVLGELRADPHRTDRLGRARRDTQLPARCLPLRPADHRRAGGRASTRSRSTTCRSTRRPATWQRSPPCEPRSSPASRGPTSCPDQALVVAVGPAEELMPQLAELGTPQLWRPRASRRIGRDAVPPSSS